MRPSVEPLWKADAKRIAMDALVEHDPSHVFALFSGGNDSTVLTHWVSRFLDRSFTAAVFIDTGTALPGVREFVMDFCGEHAIPLAVYEAGDQYDRLVSEHGFPGPASHRYAYVRLKERQLDRLVRDHKRHHRDRIMLATGVRRSESVRRMGTVQEIRRDGSTVWVAPLIDWSDADMLAYRQQHGLRQSEVAALIHRSGECNCGAFAGPGEREELKSLWPTWFEKRIAPLEAETCRKWGQRYVEAYEGDVGDLCGGCQLRMNFPANQQVLGAEKTLACGKSELTTKGPNVQ